MAMATFWAVDCTKTPADGFIFALCVKDATGQIKILETFQAPMAPAKDVQLLGDYDLCQDWLYLNRERLAAAIEAALTPGEQLIRVPPPASWSKADDELVVKEWLIQEGDPFTADRILALVEADRFVLEIWSEHAGTLTKIVVPPMGQCTYGSVIAVIKPA
jgi:hypothetical protein